MKDYKSVSHPKEFPASVTAVIEIPMNSGIVKYEICSDGFLHVDRFLPVSMNYPCNYGFIPNTLGGDGDPLDILVISRQPIAQTALVKVKPVAVLLMEDEKGPDEKVVAVPTQSVDLFYANISDQNDLPEIQKLQIKHFFERYKDLENGKFVKINGWADALHAQKIITKGFELSKEKIK